MEYHVAPRLTFHELALFCYHHVDPETCVFLAPHALCFPHKDGFTQLIRDGFLVDESKVSADAAAPTDRIYRLTPFALYYGQCYRKSSTEMAGVGAWVQKAPTTQSQERSLPFALSTMIDALREEVAVTNLKPRNVFDPVQRVDPRAKLKRVGAFIGSTLTQFADNLWSKNRLNRPKLLRFSRNR